MTTTHLPTKCSHCGSTDVHTRQVSSGPALLRGLRTSLAFPKFDVVVCAKCGRCEFFVDEAARKRVATAKAWKRVGKAG